jgi:uncharacterized protein YbjT (DUF2867 family)
MTFSILGLGLRPVSHKDTLQKRRMPLVRGISFDDQSGILILESHEYPGREPRHDALLVGEFRTRNLLAYEAAAGVGHHVALSVVGTERLLASGFFRAKMAQENLIKGSSIPYSIIRATQFFELVKGIADFSTDGNKVRLPLALIQPMAADDVASAVGRIATGSPVNGTVEVGGPEQFRLDELVRQALAARKDPREVVADSHALYYGVELSESTLLPGDGARLGETRFETWLNQPADQIPAAKPLTTAVAAASNRASGPQR